MADAYDMFAAGWQMQIAAHAASPVAKRRCHVCQEDVPELHMDCWEEEMCNACAQEYRAENELTECCNVKADMEQGVVFCPECGREYDV
jgi:hypothetical protein